MHTVSDRTSKYSTSAGREEKLKIKEIIIFETQQHPSVHHPLETSYDSAMDEPHNSATTTLVNLSS
jgi:hypothetical protein